MLLDDLAPQTGALLGVELGGSLAAATAVHAFDWLPLRVGDATMGETADLPGEDGFERRAQLWRDGERLASVELHVGVAREQKHRLDSLEKQVKARLRARLGPFSKDKLRDPRPHWIEPGDPPRLWLVLRWLDPEQAWMKVVSGLA